MPEESAVRDLLQPLTAAGELLVRENGKMRFEAAGPEKLQQAEFIMLQEGRVHFEGTAEELRRSQDRFKFHV